jgi:hypothetical protein
MASELKKELIMNAAQDIVKYIDDNCAVDVDIYAIAELININLGFIFMVVQELSKYDPISERINDD